MGSFFFIEIILSIIKNGSWIIPFFVLMTRNSKRMNLILGLTSAIIFVGHWVDYYLVIMPGLAGKPVAIGLFELGLTLGYVGLFLMVVFYYLSKADLVPSKHPFFKESLDYHTNY